MVGASPFPLLVVVVTKVKAELEKIGGQSPQARVRGIPLRQDVFFPEDGDDDEEEQHNHWLRKEQRTRTHATSSSMANIVISTTILSRFHRKPDFRVRFSGSRCRR